MSEPPSQDGAVKVTVACALPPEAVPMVGAPGATAATGVMLFEAAEAPLDPILLIAVTVEGIGRAVF
jgi:hypothetical protein